MICAACCEGADLATDPSPLVEATRELAISLHAGCRGGTWCDCQCVVPPVEVLAARRAAAPRGGLARIVGALA